MLMTMTLSSGTDCHCCAKPQPLNFSSYYGDENWTRSYGGASTGHRHVKKSSRGLASHSMTPNSSLCSAFETTSGNSDRQISVCRVRVHACFSRDGHVYRHLVCGDSCSTNVCVLRLCSTDVCCLRLHPLSPVSAPPISVCVSQLSLMSVVLVSFSFLRIHRRSDRRERRAFCV